MFESEVAINKKLDTLKEVLVMLCMTIESELHPSEKYLEMATHLEETWSDIKATTGR